MCSAAKYPGVEILGAGRGGRRPLGQIRLPSRRGAAPIPKPPWRWPRSRARWACCFAASAARRRGDQGRRRRSFPIGDPGGRLARDAERLRPRGSTAPPCNCRRTRRISGAEFNRRLYLWLAALAAVGGPAEADADPLRRDILRLRCAQSDSERAVALSPAWGHARRALRGHLRARPQAGCRSKAKSKTGYARGWRANLCTSTPPRRALAGDTSAALARAAHDTGPVARCYCGANASHHPQRRTPQRGNEGARRRRFRRRRGNDEGQRQKSDQTERKNSLILHRFESILSFGDFLNLNRDVDDEDEDKRKRPRGRRKDRPRPTPEKAQDAVEIRSRSGSGGRRPGKMRGQIRLSGMGLETVPFARRSGAGSGKCRPRNPRRA